MHCVRIGKRTQLVEGDCCSLAVGQKIGPTERNSTCKAMVLCVFCCSSLIFLLALLCLLGFTKSHFLGTVVCTRFPWFSFFPWFSLFPLIQHSTPLVVVVRIVFVVFVIPFVCLFVQATTLQNISLATIDLEIPEFVIVVVVLVLLLFGSWYQACTRRSAELI